MCFLINFLSGWSVRWWKWVLKPSTIVLLLSISLFMAASICLIYLWCWQCLMHMYLQLLYLFLDWSLDHYVVFFVSCNSPYFKVYLSDMRFVTLFLLISIFLFPGRNGMEYLFLSPHFHSVCVPRFEVGPLKTEYIRILFLYPFSLSVSFGWSIYSILHLS